jgi:hypothetical protein
MVDVRLVTATNAAELAQWCGGRLVQETDALDSSKSQPGINVPVGESVQRASVGDAIHEENGTFRVQKH